jgi:hypothetical protein
LCLPSKNENITTYKSIHFPIVLYGCGTWSLILRGKHGLRIFENWVPRRTFRLKEEEIIESSQKSA